LKSFYYYPHWKKPLLEFKPTTLCLTIFSATENTKNNTKSVKRQPGGARETGVSEMGALKNDQTH